MKHFLICIVLYCIANLRAGAQDSCPNVISKHDWGGRKAIQLEYAIRPVKFAIIHHTVTASCDSLRTCSPILKSVQNYHLDDLDYDDIGYNFLIDSNGNIYEGVGWGQVGAHTRGYNVKSVGIAFIGNYNDNFASTDQLKAAERLMSCGLKLGELDDDYRILGAKQVSQTLSPGTRLYRQIQAWPRWRASP